MRWRVQEVAALPRLREKTLPPKALLAAWRRPGRNRRRFQGQESLTLPALPKAAEWLKVQLNCSPMERTPLYRRSPSPERPRSEELIGETKEPSHSTPPGCTSPRPTRPLALRVEATVRPVAQPQLLSPKVRRPIPAAHLRTVCPKELCSRLETSLPVASTPTRTPSWTSWCLERAASSSASRPTVSWWAATLVTWVRLTDSTLALERELTIIRTSCGRRPMRRLLDSVREPLEPSA
mmetsp:Transcript_6713/g.17323  ORF Transcript_6713/g.17323 Transcript_6713/m.17323 type:complete len:237 (-) Transcript_6713:516-1226(-)